MLTEDMKRIINEQRLGFVATVDADGSPNLSPKGTMLIVDDRRLAFAEIRSPRTKANVLRDGRIEINFVDPFARRGYRFKGRARYRQPDDQGYAGLLALFAGLWPSLLPRIAGIVEVDIERALPLTTPPYDTGTTEAELRSYWTQQYRSIQPGGEFMTPGEGWKA